MNVHWSMTIPKNTLSLFPFGILAALSTLQTRQCKISKKNLKLHVFLHSNQPKNQEAQQHYQINFLKIKASCLILRLFLQMDFRLKKSGVPRPCGLVLLQGSRHLGLPRYRLLPTRKVDELNDPAGWATVLRGSFRRCQI